ncbi:MAG: NAD-dependent epimerase/dehydratase family protein, partial [Bacteroidota bacterium]
MSKNILIAGGSGLVGRRLQAVLQNKGYQVRILTRSPKTSAEFAWDPSRNFIDPQALVNVDAVVNLAGAGIADKPWTAARKKELIDSRVQSAAALEQALQNLKTPPGSYVSASAIGIYGNSGERMMAESNVPVDTSFMVDCCQQWESAAGRIASLGIRTV